jgi:hypothetical protein
MAVVISSSEYNRLRDSLCKREGTESSTSSISGEIKKDSRRVESWSDTLAARKNRYEQERTERLIKEEEERQKIDIIEANVQLQRRQEAIAKANEMLYVLCMIMFLRPQFQGK